MNLFVQLFKSIGALAAIILFVGFVASNDNDGLLEGTENATISKASLLPGGESETVVSLGDAAEGPSEMVFRSRSLSEGDAVRPAAYESTSVNPSRTATRRAVTHSEIEEWVQMNAAQSYLEAEKETVAPGVILATGIYFLQQGQADSRTNAAEIASYLVNVREHASSRAKAHMKYIANSGEWFEGLSLAGFDGAQIEQVFRDYQLGAYDKLMYSRHVERKIEQPERAAEVSELALDRADRNRNLAEAYNEYADRSEVRAKYALPTIKKPEALSAGEVSAGRTEAESFRVGESRTYQEPRQFWSVLKEVIALEKGYDSWDAYQEEHPRAADRAFQRRSDIMSNGGLMKVTRK